MVLVDIGNTNFHIFDGKKVTHTKRIVSFKDDVYYISVNKIKEEEFLSKNPGAVNLKEFVRFETSYKGLGIDRIMACKSVKEGVVVDAGSAITIDVMENGVHLGGVIMPGLFSFKKAFGTISEVLKVEFFLIDEKKLPNSTNEALNYGSLGAVKCLIEKLSKGKKIFFTGSDGKFLSEMFNNSEFVEDLVFRGMLKTINEMERK